MAKTLQKLCESKQTCYDKSLKKQTKQENEEYKRYSQETDTLSL